MSGAGVVGVAEFVGGITGRMMFLRAPEGAVLPEWLGEAAYSLGLGFGMVQGIGGFSYARIAVFDSGRGVYRYVEVRPLDENHVLEVVGLLGNFVAAPDGRVYPHLHVIVARSPSEIYAGHLLEARVKPFLELFVLEAPGFGEASLMLSHRWTRSFGAEPL